MKQHIFSIIGAVLCVTGLFLQLFHLSHGKLFLLGGFVFLLIARLKPLFIKKENNNKPTN